MRQVIATGSLLELYPPSSLTFLLMMASSSPRRVFENTHLSKTSLLDQDPLRQLLQCSSPARSIAAFRFRVVKIIDPCVLLGRQSNKRRDPVTESSYFSFRTPKMSTLSMISNHWPEDSSPSYEFCRIRGFLGNFGYLQLLPHFEISLHESGWVDCRDPDDGTARACFSLPVGKFKNNVSFADTATAKYGSRCTVVFWREDFAKRISASLSSSFPRPTNHLFLSKGIFQRSVRVAM